MKLCIPLQIIDSISRTITRDYDGLDRLTQETTPQGSVSYTYDDADRRETMTVARQPTVSYPLYDNANRLKRIEQGSSVVLFNYDDIGRRTSLTLPNGIVVEYGYDLASRITSIVYKQNGTTLLGNLTYDYDKAGNRARIGGTWARTGIPDAINSAMYNAANHQTAFGNKTLTYDNNGNLQSITDPGGTTTYTWNARNQLGSISGPGVSASFVYDGTGRREKKTINANLTEFLYDGFNPVQESSAAAVVANILPGAGIDELLMRTEVISGMASHFLSDVLGSTIALTDPAGSSLTEYTYEPFGTVTTSGSSNTNAFQYTGREDDGFGLFYYRSRYYDPKLQRFISEDPIVSASFNNCSSNEYLLRNMFMSGGGLLTQASNSYGYVGNQPTMLVDPSGLGACEAQFFNHCLPDVNKQQIQCQANTAKVASICLGTCAAGCMLLGPGPQYAACVSTCISTVCTVTVIGGNAACLAQSLYGSWQCWQDYQACKRNSKSEG